MKPEKPDPAVRSPEGIAVEIAVRLVLLGMFAWVALMLLKPFLPIVLWSAVLTVAFYPVFEWLRDRLGGRPWLAAFGVTAAAVAVTAGPTTVLLASLVHSLEELGRHLGAPPIKLPPLSPEFAGLPVVGPQLASVWNSAASNLEAFLGRYGHLLVGPGEWALGMATGLAGSLVVIFAALIVSGFLYAPAPRLVAAIRALARHLIGERGDAFIELAETTVRAVARGMVGVAVVQALLIGLGLIVMQVPAAGALTVAAFFLCTVQVGAIPIVVPILIWAWVVRSTGDAVILTAWLGLAALSDNVLKPLFLAKGLETPMPVILIGVFGGTIAYGLSGLFLGPVVLAVFYDLVRFWLAHDVVHAAATRKARSAAGDALRPRVEGGEARADGERE
ncbi:MAG: AI-2E family transporter [Amaricoccus sp.]